MRPRHDAYLLAVLSIPLLFAIPLYLKVIFFRGDDKKPGSYFESPFKSTRANTVLKESLAILMLSLSFCYSSSGFQIKLITSHLL